MSHKQQLFFRPKEKKEKGKKKKGYAFPFSQWSGGCQGFLRKILPEAQRKCGDFFQKPAGLDLY